MIDGLSHSSRATVLPDLAVMSQFFSHYKKSMATSD